MPPESQGLFYLPEMKKTKRKAFNFYRSYYDIFNKLKDDKDKLSFISALLDKQFLDVEPENLSMLVDLVWVAQYDSIDQQVKGYKSKTLDPMQGGVQPPAAPPSVGVENPPSVQEEGKGKEKEKGEYTQDPVKKFEDWFNSRRTKYLNKKSFCKLTASDKLSLSSLKSKYSQDQFEMAMESFCKDKWWIDKKMILPKHFLNEDNFSKFLNSYEPEGKNEYEEMQKKRAELKRQAESGEI